MCFKIIVKFKALWKNHFLRIFMLEIAQILIKQEFWIILMSVINIKEIKKIQKNQAFIKKNNKNQKIKYCQKKMNKIQINKELILFKIFKKFKIEIYIVVRKVK
ncbi:hypothetical protein IMG5_061770 [Ichthyophthirius multifiliis]|uniref:Uncharacterized protein n=1 Tax=Ichthyophthirius multifiliis TaxID=5932 RepID=G0QNV8_ICHMU|nr:hypothetical protein IMG5_061770 [Ichthyophthirius multifiliis]EGR33094.1 hypothetical protein IMG5_061770 [Ichthyophthirius multifiliis]|eukprot:XP_004037080.1 hypothetical protein IMG5_061770 [Ichthyophthirius multifiliis]